MRLPYWQTREKATVTVVRSKDGPQGTVRVHLDESSPKVRKAFHCPGCGYTAFEYYGSLRILIAGKGVEEISAPVVIQCNNNKCKMLFSVED